MISLTAQGRRAEEFDALLSGTDSTGNHAELVALAAVVDDLIAAAEATVIPQPSESFITHLRERLLVEADDVLKIIPRESPTRSPSSSGRYPRKARDRRLAIAAGALVIVAGSTSVAVAAQDALPGDTLYPVKRLTESIRTNLQFDDTARGESRIKIAESRLNELDILLAQRGDKTDLVQALGDFRNDGREASRELVTDYEETGSAAPMIKLDDFTQRSMDRLNTLSEKLPVTTRDELALTTRLLQDIDSTVKDLCPSCSNAVLEVPETLLKVLGSRLVDMGTPPGGPRELADAPVAPPLQLQPRNEAPPADAPGSQAKPPKADFQLPKNPLTESPGEGSRPNPQGNDGSDGGAPPTSNPPDDNLKDLTRNPTKKLKQTLEEDIPVVSPLARDLLDTLLGDNGLLGR